MWLNNFNIFEFAKRKKRPLILDGAMGSLLQQNGVFVDPYLWTCHANFTAPGLVKSIHKDYINSGADIITTNTFRTNYLAYKNSGFNFSHEEFVRQSVILAKEAKGNRNILIAGSNAPAEDCYKAKREISYSDLYENHSKHIINLANSGVDFILNETQSHLDEIKIICKICSENGIPFVLSLYYDSNFRILSGEKLEIVFDEILKYKPLAIGFNCIKPDLFPKNKSFREHNWGAYFNCGAGAQNSGEIICGISPETYIFQIKKTLSYSPSFIGACCGSTPEHIKLLKEYYG